MLDLAAELHRDERGGVVVDDVAEGGHDAVLDEGLYDLRAGLLHAAGELADADCVGNLHLYGGLFGYLELQALHTVALLGAALGAGGGLLLALLLLVAYLLLAGLAAAAIVRAVRAGHAVEALVVLAEVDVAAAAGVYDALLGHLAGHVRLLLLGSGSGLGGLGRLGGLPRLGLGGALGLLPGLLRGGGLWRGGRGGGLLRRLGLLEDLHELIHVGALMLLGEHLEDYGQLVVVEDLHMVLRRGRVLRQYLGYDFGGKAKVLGHLVNSVFLKTTH